MIPIAIDGSKITFHIPEQANRELTIDFNPGFQWAKRVGDDVVVAHDPGAGVTFIDKRRPDASIQWTVTLMSDDEKLDVSADDLRLSADQTHIVLPSKLRYANVRPESILVV